MTQSAGPGVGKGAGILAVTRGGGHIMRSGETENYAILCDSMLYFAKIMLGSGRELI